ncbi:MAG: hypothetical protein ABIX10_05750 [Acidimicrobiales bacterium]
MIAALFILGSIFNFVKADRIVEKVQDQATTSGKPISRSQVWVVGSPPSGDRVRKTSLLSCGFFALLLVINLATLK